jgi:hypothetical protein
VTEDTDAPDLDVIARKLFSGPIMFLKSAPELKFCLIRPRRKWPLRAAPMSASPRC